MMMNIDFGNGRHIVCCVERTNLGLSGFYWYSDYRARFLSDESEVMQQAVRLIYLKRSH